ncbi:MAG: 4Fe-4S binding protein [Gammaproteobacteria bacterium]|nr:4Fe-4S binding protein [Gammaproteobacteria bacterium]
MKIFSAIKAIPNGQKYRYLLLIVSMAVFLSPLALIPELFGNSDLCGRLCIRRFFLYFPGMSLEDLGNQMSVAWIGVIALSMILLTSFFFGRMWCAYICPAGGFPELASRLIPDRWKIEFRGLPQVPLRYGYFSVYLVLMPMLGISACTLCNFVTVPRIFEAIIGDFMGIAFILSAVGLVNLGLLFLLGIFAVKGRGYCQFLCPIGAIDGLVNRFGAIFRFTRRIRVERSRCTGCNLCARQCMTGAIKMEDRIAVVDQHSCMSCHECVDVCDWHAIDWVTVPRPVEPKRKKKGIDYQTHPEWKAIHIKPPKASKWHVSNWQRVIIGIIFGLLLLLVVMTQVVAAERHIDPDGCFSCHDLKGLNYIDKDGVERSATIDTSHYLSSLHGSVPCMDCHRKVKEYPHKVENTAVDCAESCHVEEPSGGEAYTHKEVVDEFTSSAHGKGWTKGLTGGNRLEESRDQLVPSCRERHSNELYIGFDDLPKFKDSFAHFDTECGSCHQGKAWLNQFGGHILRRLIGSRWNKGDSNQMCIDCHGDHDKMTRVEIENRDTGEKEDAGARFIHASDSYEMSLHGRLLKSGVEEGASCIDCHAPGGVKHAIKRDDEPTASTHPEQLAKTCAASQCHGFATNPLNSGFVQTDLHDIDIIPVNDVHTAVDESRMESNWVKAMIALLPVLLILGGGGLVWQFFGSKKGTIYAVVGGDQFKKAMIGLEPKKRPAKKRAAVKKPTEKMNNKEESDDA